jgi:hypothetical protein
MRRAAIATIAAGGLALSAAPAHAVTCAQLPGALSGAAAGATVTLDAGVTCTPGNLGVSGLTFPGGGVTLQGGGGGATLDFISTGGRILSGNDVGAATVRNLTFRGGYTSDNGAAVLFTGNSAPTFVADRFLGNIAERGGDAIAVGDNATGATTIRDSTFTSAGGPPGDFPPGGGAGAVAIETKGPITVTNSRFDRNAGSAGGGARLDTTGRIEVTGSTFTGNAALGEGGGALAITPVAAASRVVLAGNTFRDNVGAPFGGGVWISSNFSPTVEQRDNLFQGNTVSASIPPGGGSQAFGGGEWIRGANLVSRNDRFLDNVLPFVGTGAEAEGGGLGIEACNASITLNAENLVVAHNSIRTTLLPGQSTSGFRRGGGIYVGACADARVAVTLRQATITANREGGGFLASLFGGADDTLLLENSILASGSPGSELTGFAAGRIVSFSDACIGTNRAAPGSANFCANPNLVAPRARDVHQSSTSPTIDKGANALVPAGLTVDFERQARIAGRQVDVGADEVQPGQPLKPPAPGGGAPPGTGDNDRRAPSLSSLFVSPATFAVGPAPTAVSARRVPRGTVIRFRLSEAATVGLRIERALPGRRRGRRCVAPTRGLRRARRCTRYSSRGTLLRVGRAGLGRLPFSGRIGRRPLAVGRYRVVAAATDAAGNRSAVRRRAFRIVR